jgi:hypothetical protein
MPAAPAHIPSIHFAALPVSTSPTANPVELLPSPATYGASLPPAEPPTLALTQSPPNHPATSHLANPCCCLINRVLTNANHHMPPNNPANHHFSLASVSDQLSDLAALQVLPSISDSVVHVKFCPQVFRLWNNSQSTIPIKKLLSLIDGGANICLTNNLNLLVDAINIPPLPITVALDNKVTLNDCCTKRSFIPLTLADGSIHWQICYYCANAAKTIISPQAILAASSDIFASWGQ